LQSEPEDVRRDVFDLLPAVARGGVPQLGAYHAHHALFDAGNPPTGLHPYRARQGRLGKFRQFPPCTEERHSSRHHGVGIEAAFLIGGLIVTETVFNVPGVARFLVEAIRWRDYPIVQNLVMLIAVVVVVVNFAVDMLYAVFDPRIRYTD